MRKTFFTFLHEAGAPPRWVAGQGGHSDRSTSLRLYAESLRGRERSQHDEAYDKVFTGNDAIGGGRRSLGETSTAR